LRQFWEGLFRAILSFLKGVFDVPVKVEDADPTAGGRRDRFRQRVLESKDRVGP
jgi:hypothetical protein